MGKGDTTTTLERVYRIGEVAERLGIEPYVLRFWETEFPTLRPVKSPHGQRLYRDSDIDAARTIKQLLYEEGFTIAGARKRLQESEEKPDYPLPDPLHDERAPIPTHGFPPATRNDARAVLQAIRAELAALLTRLSRR